MTESLRLPVLFLSDSVLLPGMVVPIELDEAAQAAVDAARSEGGEQLLVAPRREDRYPSYGVVATIEKVGRFRGGAPGRGAAGRSAGADRQRRHRPRRGAVGGDDPGAGRAGERARCRAGRRLQGAGRGRAPAPRGVADRRLVQQPDRPRRSSPTRRARRRTSRWSASGSCSRRRRRSSASSCSSGGPRSYLAELEVSEKIGEDVRQSVDRTQREFLLRQQLAAIRKELGEGEPDGVRRLPRPGRGRRRPGRGARGAAARGRQAGAGQRAEPRGAVDPDLARHRARAAVARHDRGRHRPRRRPRGPRRRPPRAGRRQGADRRAPRRPRPAAPSAASRSSAAAAAAP